MTNITLKVDGKIKTFTNYRHALAYIIVLMGDDMSYMDTNGIRSWIVNGVDVIKGGFNTKVSKNILTRLDNIIKRAHEITNKKVMDEYVFNLVMQLEGVAKTWNYRKML